MKNQQLNVQDKKKRIVQMLSTLILKNYAIGMRKIVLSYDEDEECQHVEHYDLTCQGIAIIDNWLRIKIQNRLILGFQAIMLKNNKILVNKIDIKKKDKNFIQKKYKNKTHQGVFIDNNIKHQQKDQNIFRSRLRKNSSPIKQDSRDTSILQGILSRVSQFNHQQKLDQNNKSFYILQNSRISNLEKKQKIINKINYLDQSIYQLQHKSNYPKKIYQQPLYSFNKNYTYSHFQHRPYNNQPQIQYYEPYYHHYQPQNYYHSQIRFIKKPCFRQWSNRTKINPNTCVLQTSRSFCCLHSYI